MQKTSFSFLVIWAVYAISAFLVCFPSKLRAEDEGYEIVSHAIRLQLFPDESILSCNDTLNIHVTRRGLDHVKLQLLRLFTITSLEVDYKPRTPLHDHNDVLIDNLPSDTLFSVVISYGGTFPERTEFSSISRERSILREHEVLPMGPRAYRSLRIRMVVPRDWQTTAVGEIAASSIEHDSSVVVWETRSPVPEIGWICSGRYVRHEDTGGDILVRTLLFSEDSSAASRVDSLAQSVLSDYSKRFIRYRFFHLNIVEVEDWVAGSNVIAIAAPSFIMVKKLAFVTDDAFNKVQAVLPHEIAHQWWPMTVFIDDSDATMLSEGMCEYSAMLYAETHGARSRRDSLSVHPLLRPLLNRISKGKEIPLQQKTDIRFFPTHYLKALFVFNMLRKYVGDDAFTRLLHEYALRFQLRKVSFNDFARLAEEISGKKLNLFFQQWVQQNDIPRLKIYNVHSTQEKKGWVTRGRVRLLGYERFSTFADIGVTIRDSVQTTRVMLGLDSSQIYHNDVPFEIATLSKPRYALIDPHGDLLKYQRLPVKLSDIRDPSDGTMIVGTKEHAGYLLQRAQSDMSQMSLAGWSLRIMPDTAVNLSDLQQDHIFLYGTITENRVVENLENKFPVTFDRDSLTINGERIFDSSLTLIQIIESPYAEQGSICWIAPMSDRALPELLPYDASWVLVRGKDEVSSGTWGVKDEDLEVEIK